MRRCSCSPADRHDTRQTAAIAAHAPRVGVACALVMAGLLCAEVARAQVVYRCTAVAGEANAPLTSPCPEGQRRIAPAPDAPGTETAADTDVTPACRAARAQRAQTALRVDLHDNRDALRALDQAVRRACES